MAVEYETTTPSTPSTTLFPLSNKKRVLKHCQENFRANILFCGKRKRSHRLEYENHRHSSSVPRQSSLFAPKASYLEYKNRNRGLSKLCDRIQPLNKSIVSKIEKISQDTKFKLATTKFASFDIPRSEPRLPILVTHPSTSENDETQKTAQVKSSSFESTLLAQGGALKKTKAARKAAKHRRRQLQFNDENSFMDCGLTDLLSSSSLSSSDSEPVFANESDHEGDDELTDWPGNEAMINFASKHDFKRAKARPKLPQIPQMQDDLIQDDDTLMSTDVDVSAFRVETPGAYSARSVSIPIDIATPYQHTKQIESEMSGDTSNNILSSPNTNFTEVREIISGCRRIEMQRKSVRIITPVNEQLAR